MTFFFYGSNTFALRQQITKMTREYEKRTGSDFGLERLDGASIKPKELGSALMAAPFLATSRMVIIESIAANKSKMDLGTLLTSVPASTVAVFVEAHADRRTVAFKSLSKADRVMEFKPLASSQLVSWANSEVARLGAVAEKQALIDLVELIGDDQWRLNEELQKLANFSQEITRASVRELVVAGVEQSIFELVDAITAGRIEEALSSYRGLIARRESEIYILTMIQWQLRNLLWGAAMPDDMTQAELARASGISPYVAGKAMAARKRLDRGKVCAAYMAASETEYEIKTGRIKPEPGVELLIYTITNSMRQ
jgi:DNA polymerase-3 subunit delta